MFRLGTLLLVLIVKNVIDESYRISLERTNVAAQKKEPLNHNGSDTEYSEGRNP